VDVRVRFLLGLYRLFPVHADLVRRHPEETSWIFARQTGTWMWAALILLVGHFCVPFTVLLSRGTKRRLGLLGFFAAWLLVMHWVDMWWLITPRLSPGNCDSTGCM